MTPNPICHHGPPPVPQPVRTLVSLKSKEDYRSTKGRRKESPRGRGKDINCFLLRGGWKAKWGVEVEDEREENETVEEERKGTGERTIPV